VNRQATKGEMRNAAAHGGGGQASQEAGAGRGPLVKNGSCDQVFKTTRPFGSRRRCYNYSGRAVTGIIGAPKCRSGGEIPRPTKVIAMWQGGGTHPRAKMLLSLTLDPRLRFEIERFPADARTGAFTTVELIHRG